MGRRQGTDVGGARLRSLGICDRRQVCRLGQPEEGEADLGLVLQPDYRGYGKVIYDEIIRRAFGEMGLESVTILFPSTRTRVKGILRLGFQPDGEVEIGGERFIRYRLKK
jgi:hypothetical protein